MNHVHQRMRAGNRSPEALLASSIHSIIRRLGPRRTLVLSGYPHGLPELDGMGAGFVVTVDTGGPALPGSLECAPDALPFEDGAFNMVLAHHVIFGGNEPELGEVRRVLSGDGQIIVTGRGRFGMSAGGDNIPPAIDARSICRHLEEKAFDIRQCEGIGLRGRPVRLQTRWQKAVLPFSDLVLIRGQHRRHKHVVTPLRFGQPQAAAMQSAVHEGMQRKAV